MDEGGVHFITFINVIVGIQVTVATELNIYDMEETLVIRKSRLQVVQGETHDLRAGILAEEIFSYKDISFAYRVTEHYIKKDLFTGIQ